MKKMSKDAWRKSQFWILLPLAIVAVFIAFSIGRSRAAEELAKFEAAKELDRKVIEQLQKAHAIKGESTAIQAAREKALAEEERTRLWNYFYRTQNNLRVVDGKEVEFGEGKLIKWPNIEHLRNLGYDKLEFGDILGKDGAHEAFPIGYDWMLRGNREQGIQGILDILPLWTPKGGGVRIGAVAHQVVPQTGQTGFDGQPIFKPDEPKPAERPVVLGGNSREQLYAMLRPISWKQNVRIDSYEAWLAMEDLAIKREILLALKTVIDAQTQFRSEFLPTHLAAEALPTATGDVRVDRLYFYNTAWHSTSQPTETVPPVLPRHGGWGLDLTISKKGSEYFLSGVSVNYSTQLSVPPLGVRVFYLEANSERENYVDVPEAGGLERATASAPTRLEIKPIRLPSPAEKLTRVERLTKDASVPKRLANPDWIMDVALVREATGWAVQGKLFNRSGKRTVPPNLSFTLGSDTSVFPPQEDNPVGSGPVNAWGEATFKFPVKATGAGTPTRIVSISQAVDWQTVPIKRIDAIDIGPDAVRNADGSMPPLREYGRFKDRAPAKPKPAVPVSPVPPEVPVGVQPPVTFPPTEQPTVSTPAVTVTTHGLEANRYQEVTSEVRRIPLTIVVVVDMNRINDVLAAFANSRLRIQITYSAWRRLTGLGDPHAIMVTPITKPDQPVVPPKTPLPPSRVMAPEDEGSVVRLVFHGLATIYERPSAR